MQRCSGSTTMFKVLLIDDDASLLDLVALAFEDAGFTVLTASDGQTGYKTIVEQTPHLVVSDVNMPRLDGFALCRKLRGEQNFVPLLLLTSRGDEIDEALGLELGADDYLSKPFSTRVLLARAQVLMRREQRRGQSEVEQAVKRGELELLPDRLEVRYRQTPLKVTLTEFRLLEALAKRPGLVLSRDRLLEIVRGDDSVVAARIVDTYVGRLRRKLEAIDERFDRLETVVGAGYRWRDDG
jgi:DNA-binding response OmpR family regulator